MKNLIKLLLYENMLKNTSMSTLQVTRGTLIAHRYTYAPPRCRTLQYSRTFIPLSVSI